MNDQQEKDLIFLQTCGFLWSAFCLQSVFESRQLYKFTHNSRFNKVTISTQSKGKDNGNSLCVVCLFSRLTDNIAFIFKPIITILKSRFSIFSQNIHERSICMVLISLIWPDVMWCHFICIQSQPAAKYVSHRIINRTTIHTLNKLA